MKKIITAAFVFLLLLGCVKTSAMIKNHRGALLSTLYTRLSHIYWYLHDFEVIRLFLCNYTINPLDQTKVLM